MNNKVMNKTIKAMIKNTILDDVGRVIDNDLSGETGFSRRPPLKKFSSPQSRSPR